MALVRDATRASGHVASVRINDQTDSPLFHPTAGQEPHGLIWMYGSFRVSQTGAVSPPDFVDYRDRNDVFLTRFLTTVLFEVQPLDPMISADDDMQDRSGHRWRRLGKPCQR